MSGCFLAKYLVFLVFEAKKQGKNPPKSDIQCQGQTEKNALHCFCKKVEGILPNLAGWFLAKYLGFFVFR